MYITDLLLWNSKHKSNNVIILEETINEICNCKINPNVIVVELSLRIPFKVMPLFSSRSFFQGSNEVVYVNHVNVLGLSPLLLSGFRWCLLRSVCSGISLWWWRCLDVSVGPFQFSMTELLGGWLFEVRLKWFHVGLFSLSMFWEYVFWRPRCLYKVVEVL